ncbi:hypothetical protein SUDANB121_01845 [Nocardiopsis dassonvillei]|uniref:hypothetical protein n=1 Tax=Nocardiopsis dassonvillei TaxID=2014 RepID=UPI003F57CC8B
MPWDVRERRRYEDEVLAAARTGGPPADLFVRYGVGPELERRLAADPEAFAAHVAAVCTYWRGLQTRRRTLRRVLLDLVAAHERLAREGALTHGHFSRVREETARRALAEWSDLVDGLATSLVDRWALRAMAGSVGLPEAEAERLLRERGVRVVERLPELPVQPPVRTFRSLRDNLRTRGAVFSPEVVFGAGRLVGGFTVVDGFRLADGGVLDDAALDAAVARVQVEPLTEGKAAAESVLGVLRSCSSRAERDAVVLWEVAEDLRARPAEVGEAALARPWVRRGLAEPEAALLAAAVRRRPAGSERIARAEREVRDLLADDQLRQARAAVAGLPADHGLAAQVRERESRVEELSAQAEAALREGRDEEAARALAAACALAADDDGLRARLGEVPPLPPREVHARVEGRGAVVEWRPSPSLVGRIGYRVLRRVGRGGRQAPAGEVTGTEFIDPGLPVGAEVRYTVAAVREGRGASEPVVTDPVLLAPEVADLSVHAGESEVTGSWRVPPEAVRVEVVRGEGAPPRGGDGVRVVTDGMGFRDPDVRPDVEYYYRVRAVYLTSGGSARGSEGLVRRVVPGPPPPPVEDLLVVPDGEGGFTASWTPPRRGRVSLRAAAAPPPWPPGTRVSPAELAAHGVPLPAAAADAPRGRSAAVPEATPGTDAVGAPVPVREHRAGRPPAVAPATHVAPAPPAAGATPETETAADDRHADRPTATVSATCAEPATPGTGETPVTGAPPSGRRAGQAPAAAPATHTEPATPTAVPETEAAAHGQRTGRATAATSMTRTGSEPTGTGGIPEAGAPPSGRHADRTAGTPAAAPARPEREQVRVVLGPGPHHVVAVTSCGDQTVVGASVRVLSVPAVAGLHARRFGDLVRLGWTWPEEASAATVSWRPADPGDTGDTDGGGTLCERTRYEAGGGFEAPMGPGPVRVTVRAVVGGTPGPPAVLTVPGEAVLAYHVAPAGLLRRDRLVTVAAGTSCTSPRIAVVYAEGGFPPDRVDQGRVLAVFPPRRLAAGQRLSLRVRPPRPAGPAWLVCLPLAGDLPDGTRLCQPSVKELRL